VPASAPDPPPVAAGAAWSGQRPARIASAPMQTKTRSKNGQEYENRKKGREQMNNTIIERNQSTFVVCVTYMPTRKMQYQQKCMKPPQRIHIIHNINPITSATLTTHAAHTHHSYHHEHSICHLLPSLPGRAHTCSRIEATDADAESTRAFSAATLRRLR
jgi:hypothetical protein